VVVIEGEDAVNIIQQKTAVLPIVEVRDANDLPVSGAIVTFAMRGGGATLAGGASSITVTTSAAGRAALTSLNPIAPGSLQIQVSAAFQGQTATATIVQTNVMTVTEAAQLGSAGASTGAGSSSGTSGAAGASGGGGGLSGTAIGVIAAAASASAVVASRLAGDGNGSEPGLVGPRTFTAPFSGEMVLSSAAPGPCLRRESYNGSLTIRIVSQPDAPIDGTAEVGANGVVIGSTCTGGPQAGAPNNLGPRTTALIGAPENLTFRSQTSNSFPPSPGDPSGGTFTVLFTFTGTLIGGEITGTLTQSHTITNNQNPEGPPFAGTVSYAVVLR
jgi:hypothetical protein